MGGTCPPGKDTPSFKIDAHIYQCENRFCPRGIRRTAGSTRWRLARYSRRRLKPSNLPQLRGRPLCLPTVLVLRPHLTVSGTKHYCGVRFARYSVLPYTSSIVVRAAILAGNALSFVDNTLTDTDILTDKYTDGQAHRQIRQRNIQTDGHTDRQTHGQTDR